MDIADIVEPVPESVKEEDVTEAGNTDGNTPANVEENKFQRAIAAWRSTTSPVMSNCAQRIELTKYRYRSHYPGAHT